MKELTCFFNRDGTLTSNFHFLADEWPRLFESATRTEALAHSDPRAACFYARWGLEQAVQWLYRADGSLRKPYQEHLNALLHEPTFRTLVGPIVFAKAKMVKDLGNLAVHSHKKIGAETAVTAARELFHVLFWVARRYARRTTPSDALRFDAALLPPAMGTPSTQSLDQLRQLERTLHERDGKLAALDEEIARLRAEIVQAKRANDARPDTHDYSEADTRTSFVDVMLKEAGWALADARDREFEVDGMPNQHEKGYVDYVLWGDDGHAACLGRGEEDERQTRRADSSRRSSTPIASNAASASRPVIFYSNGYEHWVWDDVSYPPREVQGFYTKDQLELLIQRRTTRKRLADAPIDAAIVERGYQQRAIRRIGEAFENDHDRKALIVMATGAGKTRTVIALIDLLMRCNWVKRVLFLADRNALVKQAVARSRSTCPASSPVNLVTEKEKDGRVLVSTYPTMMGLIDESRDGERRFGVGHFDLIVIDEAHRSVYQKYRAIFDYFDTTGRPDGDAAATRSTATPTGSSTSKPASRPTPTRSTDAIKDGFLVRRKRFRFRSSSSARGFATPNSPRTRKTSGTRRSGTRTVRCPPRSTPEP